MAGPFSMTLDKTQRDWLRKGLPVNCRDEYDVGDTVVVAGMGTYRVLQRDSNGFGFVYRLENI